MQDEVLKAIEAQDWRRARSTFNPHEYIVRGRCHLDDWDFNRIVRFIRENGVPRGWGRKTYIVWYAPDGYHYWTMGWPIPETDIINRARSDIEDQTYAPRDGEPFSSPSGMRPEYA